MNHRDAYLEKLYFAFKFTIKIFNGFFMLKRPKFIDENSYDQNERNNKK